MRAAWSVVVGVMGVAGCRSSSAEATAPATASASASGSGSASGSESASVSASASESASASGSASASASAPDSDPASASSLPCTAAPLPARLSEAQSLYGPTVRTSLLDSTFLFIDPDHSPLFPDALALASRVLSALRHDRIAPHPLCPVAVYLFSSRPRFETHCGKRHYVPDSGRDWGVYDPLRGEIVVDLSGGAAHVPTLAHELAHVLADADFALAPQWFRECVGALYEAPLLPADGEIHGADDWRYGQLRDALARGDADAHLQALFGMSTGTFRAKLDGGAGRDGARYLLHYAAARATCQWLDEQGQLWPFFRAWRDGFALDPDGTASFARVTGHAPPDLDAAWRAWALRTRG
jgi:hypothetical protein